MHVKWAKVILVEYFLWLRFEHTWIWLDEGIIEEYTILLVLEQLDPVMTANCNCSLFQFSSALFVLLLCFSCAMSSPPLDLSNARAVVLGGLVLGRLGKVLLVESLLGIDAS